MPAHAASPFAGHKIIAAYHPAACLRIAENAPLLQFDLRKAVREADFPEYRTRERLMVVPATVDGACTELLRIREAKKLTGTDIEGYWNNLTSISFANDPLRAVVIPFVRCDGTRYWQEQEEWQVLRAVAQTLEDPFLPKVFQNGLYDRFALWYGYQIRAQNCVEDTMLKWWELYAELPKSLDTQVSILIPDVPYYKGDRKTMDDTTFFRYNGLDSACTLEIAQTLDRVNTRDFPECAKRHYRFNNAMLNPLLYMEKTGILYDTLGAMNRRDVLCEKMFALQARLNGLCGCTSASISDLWTRAREKMAYVKASIASLDFVGIADNAKMKPKRKGRPAESFRSDAMRMHELVTNPHPSLTTIGELEDLADVSLNLSSGDQIIPFLYETLKLPVQTKLDDEGKPRPTADYEALLKLSKLLQREGDTERLAIIQLCIELRSLETRQGMLSIEADEDGRIRCGYNIVGSNTGRITCYRSPTGSGYNLQTIPNYKVVMDAPGGVLGDRDLFLSDPGQHFFECDLSGADGWTYAAYSAMLGDPTMLEDYLAGISPFDIMTLKHRGVDVDFNDRKALKEAKTRLIKKSDWDRFAFKRVQHGGAYMEGGLTISTNILKDSEGKCFIEPAECTRFRDFVFFGRYPGIRKWHGWVASRLRERPELVAASGQARKFFGRPDEILTQAVAFEPQSNTTYATNLAMFNLWNDVDNRVATPMGLELRIQPLHQVHDALCGQFQITDTPWAVGKIRAWFNNPITIAGQKIVIPFDGSYGPSWGTTDLGKI